ncbi:MAG: efflux RND transporter permease subunit [Cyclobacteriaceae bacterium]
MAREKYIGNISSFRVIATFVLLAIIGISVIPLLDLNYKPSRTNNTLTISYSWHNVSPEIIEREVTSRIEGTLATLQGVTDIYSESATGNGFVRLKFDEVEDQQLLRFEIATLIRQVTSTFPQGVSYPIIYYGGESESRTLMTYTLNGKYSPQELQEYAEKYIKRPLSEIRELQEVNVYGAEPVEWELLYDIHQLTGLGLTPDDLSNAIRQYLDERPLGLTSIRNKQGPEAYTGVYLTTSFDHDVAWDKIPVTKKGDRIIFLNTVSKIRKTHREPTSYYRINGLNAINIVLVASEQVNELVAGREVKELMDQLVSNLPANMTLTATYDSTEHMQSELLSIVWRMGLSILILLIFVWMTSRNPAYMAIVFVGIIVNVLVAFIFYFLLGIEIQLYSLAGLTISLGIIIDNTIVMIDHLRHQHNRNVFLAILAATLTTIGALSIIFFLEEEQVLRLLDFAYILAINLLVSLAISWYFVPALMDKIRLKKRINRRSIRNKRRVVRFNGGYFRVLGFLARFKVALFVLLIIGFGLPIYLLPESLGEKDDVESHTWHEELYNSSLGSDWYRNTLHTPLQKWLGGTLYQFYRNVYTSSFYGEPERTTLYFNGRMPPGANIHQVNEAFRDMENFISQFDEVEQFETRITGIRNARITIRFKPEHEMTYFPYYLKARLTEKAIHLGGIESGIYGVGRGFSNALNLGYKNTHLYLYGYSYQNLLGIAEGLRAELLTQERIKEVDIQGTTRFSGAPTYEYYMAFDPYEIKRQGIGITRLSQFLSETNISEQTVWRGNIEGTVANLNMKPDENNLVDTWNIQNFPIATGDTLLHKLTDLGEINIRKSGDKIVRRDQQYQVVLAFDYIGSSQLKKRVVDRFIEETNDQLPIGYFIEQRGYWGWREDGKQYGLIGLVILIIFIIGATLFESLRQPLFAIMIIPVSFMGIFLTFYLFELNFDQGGYASFILLSGISVNAAFFIINDYNNLKKQFPRLSSRVLYLRAFNHKILPILLTIISTVAGMIPFLIDGQNQVFWFALAAGTVGGLIFSVVGIFLVLPLFLKSNKL